MYKLGILSLALLVGCATQVHEINKYEESESYSYANSYSYDSDGNYQKVYDLSQEQAKTGIGYRYISSALIQKHNEHWSGINRNCSDKFRGEIESFNMVVAISFNGNVEDIVSTKNNDFVDCYKAKIKKITYPKPPFKNFYFYISGNAKT
ncbi:hypothetical protein [Marinomonas sp. 2405UD68-3]|uniref:hypothetical protein n=1 Tax=Marinomonas sp. 2405UD68-3 TaxID=3391835 RepID=UPI0039C9F450